MPKSKSEQRRLAIMKGAQEELEVTDSNNQWKPMSPHMAMPQELKLLVFELADLLGKQIVWREDAHEEELRPGMYTVRKKRVIKLEDK